MRAASGPGRRSAGRPGRQLDACPRAGWAGTAPGSRLTGEEFLDGVDAITHDMTGERTSRLPEPAVDHQHPKRRLL
jgi:hypothetical protein